MPLHHVEPVGERAGDGVEDRDPGAARAEVEPGAVVEAAAEALVDEAVGRAGRVEHVAEGGEGFGGEGFGRDAPHGRSALRRCQAMRSTCAQASANSVARSLASLRWKAARIEALVLSRTAMMKGKPNLAV